MTQAANNQGSVVCAGSSARGRPGSKSPFVMGSCPPRARHTMRNTLRVLSIGTAIGLLATSGALGQVANYVLDNNTIQYGLNASDTTEPRDNWFANEFTAQLNANTITRVDFGIVT